MHDWILQEWFLTIVGITLAIGFWGSVLLALRRFTAGANERLVALANARPGQTLEEFKDYSEIRGVKSELAVAVYAMLQELIPSPHKQPFAISPEDLINEYGIDEDDVYFAIIDIARRFRLVLPKAEQASTCNPMRSVEDIVLFLAACPSRRRSGA